MPTFFKSLLRPAILFLSLSIPRYSTHHLSSTILTTHSFIATALASSQSHSTTAERFSQSIQASRDPPPSHFLTEHANFQPQPHPIPKPVTITLECLSTKEEIVTTILAPRSHPSRRDGGGGGGGGGGYTTVKRYVVKDDDSRSSVGRDRGFVPQRGGERVEETRIVRREREVDEPPPRESHREQSKICWK